MPRAPPREPTVSTSIGWSRRDIPRMAADETTGRGARQDAAGVCVLPDQAGRTTLRARLPPPADAQTDAATRRFRREVPDRRPSRVSGQLVRSREALAGAPRRPPQLLRCQRLPVPGRLAAQRLDPPAGSARLVPVVLPVLHGATDG